MNNTLVPRFLWNHLCSFTPSHGNSVFRYFLTSTRIAVTSPSPHHKSLVGLHLPLKDSRNLLHLGSSQLDFFNVGRPSICVATIPIRRSAVSYPRPLCSLTERRLHPKQHDLRQVQRPVVTTPKHAYGLTNPKDFSSRLIECRAYVQQKDEIQKGHGQTPRGRGLGSNLKLPGLVRPRAMVPLSPRRTTAKKKKPRIRSRQSLGCFLFSFRLLLGPKPSRIILECLVSSHFSRKQ